MIKNKVIDGNIVKINNELDFFTGISKGVSGKIIGCLIDEVVFVWSEGERGVEVGRSLCHLRLANKKMKEWVDFFVKERKVSYICPALIGVYEHIKLPLMYVLRYKVARDRFLIIEKAIEQIGARWNEFKEVIEIGKYGIMLWMCQFGEKRERAYGEEKMDSKLLAICDKEGKKVEDVDEFVQLFTDKVVGRYGVSVNKFKKYNKDLKKFCSIKVENKDGDVDFKKKIKVFSKMVLRMMRESDVARKEEEKENKKLLKEDDGGKRCEIF